MSDKLNHPLALVADQIADLAHKGQMRKWASDPYIVHPRRVAAMVAKLDGTDHVDVAAALLHDVVEDTEVKEDRLRNNLLASLDGYTEDDVNATVALVMELTKTYPDDEERLLSRAEKRERDWAQLRSVSKRAQRIKMCDRIDNITGSPMPSGMRRKYKPESLTLAEICRPADEWLYQRLLDAIATM